VALFTTPAGTGDATAQNSSPYRAFTTIRSVTTGQLARRLNIHRTTVRRWCETEKIPATRTKAGWRIDYGVADALVDALTPATVERI
jgi:excisionase family DNA binding protein